MEEPIFINTIPPLVSRSGSFALHNTVRGRGLERLCNAVGSVLERDMNQWTHPVTRLGVNECYLKARDQESWMERGVAETMGCAIGEQSDESGKVECVLTGRQIIEDAIKDAESKQSLIAPDRKLGFGMMREEERTWRTYLMERMPVLSSAHIASASVLQSDDTGFNSGQ